MYKALMLACYFPPFGGMGVQRILKFVKYLPEFGWTPYVLTLKEDYAFRAPGYLTWFKPKDTSLLKEVPEGVKIFRTQTFEYARMLKSIFIKTLGSEGLMKVKERKERAIYKFLRSILEFPDEETGWIPFAIFHGASKIKKEKIDLIFTTSPPHSIHLSGFILKRISSLPWIVDFRDEWTTEDWFHPPMQWRVKAENYLEKKVLEYADKVICNTAGMKKKFLEKYPHIKEEKFVIITNGFDEEDFLKAKKDIDEKFTITYAGTIRFFFHGKESPRYNPKNFLIALSLLLNEKPHLRKEINVQFFIYPREEIEFLHFAKEFNVADVCKVKLYAEHKECISALLSSSVLLLLHHSKNEGGSSWIPAKVYEYLRAKRPILALLPKEGDTATLLRRVSNAWIVPPEDIKEIKHTLYTLFNLHKEGKLSAHVDEVKLKEYERRELTRKLSDVFFECIMS